MSLLKTPFSLQADSSDMTGMSITDLDTQWCNSSCSVLLQIWTWELCDSRAWKPKPQDQMHGTYLIDCNMHVCLSIWQQLVTAPPPPPYSFLKQILVWKKYFFFTDCMVYTVCLNLFGEFSAEIMFLQWNGWVWTLETGLQVVMRWYCTMCASVSHLWKRNVALRYCISKSGAINKP